MRGTQLRVITKGGRSSLIERPLLQLFPLETQKHSLTETVAEDSVPENHEKSDVDRPRRRTAASNADLIRRLTQFDC